MGKKLKEADKKRIAELKAKGSIPSHIAIIMDGNGRWANKRGLPRVTGHHRGVEVVREIVEACAELGVKFLTLYTFSTENWKRPADEVSTLMRLIVKSLQNETDELHANNIRLTTIGNMETLPVTVQKELKSAINKTAHNSRMTLNLALSYSGRWEITEAVKAIAADVADGKVKPDEIDETMISSFLNTAEMPDPDLLIRSGGELRISNFLLWQIAYTEIFVTDVLWPDFSTKILLQSLTEFQKRERRFGLISEQLSSKNNNTQHAKKLSKQVV